MDDHANPAGEPQTSQTANPKPPAPPTPFGWVKLWHPAGVQVSLPVPQTPLNYVAMFENVSAALAAGWGASMAGLEAGEIKDEVGWVVRTLHDSRNGGEVSAVDLYLPDDRFTKVRTYLNTPADVAAFEAATGLKLETLAPYVGTNKVERGASKQADKFVFPTKGGSFVWKPNPKYDPAETDPAKKKAARLFVRWDGIKTPAGQQGQPQAGQQPTTADDDAVMAKWKEFCKSDPPVDVFNSFCEREFPAVPEHLKRRVKGGIAAHAREAGWVWNDSDRCYMPPRASDADSGTTIPF